MKSSHDIEKIYRIIIERFGEPIGKATDAGEGVADERGGHVHKGEDMGNRGWGSDLCEGCGAMGELDQIVCQDCGMMSSKMDEDEAPTTTSDKSDLVGKDVFIGGGKASVQQPTGTRSSSVQKDKKNTGPSVDWSGMDEADMDEMKLGVSGRWGGEGSGHSFDDAVKEPEEAGAKLDPRDTFDVKKKEEKPMSLSIDEDSFVKKAGGFARKMAAGSFDRYGRAVSALGNIPGMPAGDIMKVAGEFNKGIGNFISGEKDVDEVAPPGGEKVVKALKKDKNVDNPWAVAWSMKNKGEI